MTQAGGVRVGCSGWSYEDWRGRFYPTSAPARSWFSHYSRQFDTVELNNTFYRLPTEQAIEGWRQQAPTGFVYAVKLGQFGSHRMKLRDPEPWLAKHLERVRSLGQHLGPNLVQLPPRWKRDVPRLDDFLHCAPKDIRWAIEFRDPSWLHEDVFQVLERHNAALCVHDLITGHPWIRTADWTYVRFHGPNATTEAYHGRYDANRLRRASQRLADWRDDGVDVFAYFNNDYDAHAVSDALWLRTRLSRQAAPVRLLNAVPG